MSGTNGRDPESSNTLFRKRWIPAKFMPGGYGNDEKVINQSFPRRNPPRAGERLD
ncbi:MAG: hypothetical protein FD165_1408 [Gammaproteobacteria bacterium]|nr:MAG: hypothetical protein FD165_1408 [Gammaproteobacteria bacterium]